MAGSTTANAQLVYVKCCTEQRPPTGLFLACIGNGGPNKERVGTSPWHGDWPVACQFGFADTLYSMLAQKLRGFEECDAPKLYRHFVRGKGTVVVENRKVIVTYPRRAHNPILRAVPWGRLPMEVPGLKGSELELKFK